MKKIISLLLTITTVFSMAATTTFALGENKVVDNEWGDKTYYVSSEKLTEYMDELKNQVNQCWQEHDDWFGTGSWKGNLATISPLIITLLFYPISYKFMKIYNRYKVKPVINDASSAQSNTAIAKIDDSISWLQFFAMTIGGAATTLGSLIVSKKYSAIDKLCDCELLASRYKGIIRDFSEYDPSNRIWTDGAKIICQKDLPCHVNIQKKPLLPQLEYKGI